MVGRICVGTSGNKKNLVIIPVPHGSTGPSVFTLMKACAKDVSCLLTVVEDALSVTPSVGCEKQSHSIELLSVGSGTIGVFSSVSLAGPGKITLVIALLHVHVGLGPLPDSVEFLLHIKLNTHHHSVGHSLSSGVVVAGIRKITHILACFVVYSLIFIIKEGVYSLLKLSVYLFLCFTDLSEKIAVFSGFISVHVVFLLSCAVLCRSVK